MKHPKRIIFTLLTIVVLSISLLVAQWERMSLCDSILIHVIDVGQADCMVIETPSGKNIIIDTGTDLAEETLRAYLHSNGLTQFDCMILSHPHDDHIGGADMILREFSVKQVICADNGSEETVWYNVRNMLDEKSRTGEVEWIKPVAGTAYWVDELKLEVLLAPVEGNKGTNDDSIIIRVVYGDCAILLTGDAEANAEDQLLATVPNEKIQADFLKVGHHGSSSSTTEAFLQVVRPKIASISSGSGNSFSHPHEELLHRLREADVAIYRTDLEGSLVFSCDGKTFSLRSPYS